MHAQNTFRFRDDLVVDHIDGEVLILDLHRNIYFSLNPVGQAVWQAIGDKLCKKDIEDKLTQQFDVDIKILRRDMDAFLTSLLNQNLIYIHHA